MRYPYYPGCSNHASSKDYHQSALAVCQTLGVELKELQDWNCCGTTGVSTVDPMLSIMLSARNLALAEKEGTDLVVTCNSCFSQLMRANDYYFSSRQIREKIADGLHAIGREYRGGVRVRHLLDVLVNDIGLETIQRKAVARLNNLRIVPYYGCLIGRPENEFEDPEFPTSMDRLLEAVGAKVVPFDRKAKCCGGALMTTKEDVALKLCEEILHEAESKQAALIAVACPMCQLNLDAYQSKINAKYFTNYQIPVLFFTQLVGIALGLSKTELALGKTFVPAEKIVKLSVSRAG